MIDTCIIPAAGKGSRWAPISGYLPKEMLPLLDRPVIDWVVREAIHSGCKRIIIVTNKNKKIIKNYFNKESGRYKGIEFIFVLQEQPKGLVNALSLCKKYISSDFAMALPDLPTISAKPVLKQLIKSFEENTQSSIISLDEFPSESLGQYTECKIELLKRGTFKVNHFCPKSKTSHHPKEKLRMSGRYVLKKDLFKLISDMNLEMKTGEQSEVEILKKALSNNIPITALAIKGHTYDTGTPISYVRANTAFYKKSLLKQL